MHASSMKLMSDFISEYRVDVPGNTVIDFGAKVYSTQARGKAEIIWHPSYRELFSQAEYTGFDLESGRNVDIVGYVALDAIASVKQWDVLISGQCMEHVEYPWVWLTNLKKYVKTGGMICIIVPYSWKEHRYPIDCYRFLPDGMRALFKWADIEEIKIYRDFRDTVGIGKVKKDENRV